ncbi:MAG: sugar phosphate isomerase/epimerase [Acidobacteria bacterium]|nr:sugar phosphate isomerase/epimerase [Acidobacteriota bacterium]
MRRRELILSGAAVLAAAAPGKVRIGCQTRSYGDPPRDTQSLYPLLEDMKDAGYEGFETNYAVLDGTGDRAKARAEIARRTPLVGLHVGLRWKSAETEAANEANLQRAIQGTTDLGGTHVMISGAAPREAWGRRLDLLRKAAAGTSIRLCVHNHIEETRGRFAEMRHVAQNSQPGALWFFFDIGHAAVAGADAAAFVREFSGRIAGFHIRDRVGDDQVPMGTGKVDLVGVAQAIRDTSWSGWVIAELEGNPVPGVTPRQNVRAAREFVRTRMKLG